MNKRTARRMHWTLDAGFALVVAAFVLDATLLFAIGVAVMAVPIAWGMKEGL